MSRRKIVKFEVSSARARIYYEETDNNIYYTPEGVLDVTRKLTDMCKELEAMSIRGF